MFDIFTSEKYNTVMQPEYIVMIVIGAVFALLLIVFIIVYFRKKKIDEQNRADLENMYSDKNLAKMEYDCAVYDEETEKLLSLRKQGSGQLTIDDVLEEQAPVPADDKVFQTVEKEGLEEIKGNYKPD